MEPVIYETKQNVTVDEQLKELRIYVSKISIYYNLNQNEIERKKNLTINLLSKSYLIAFGYALYHIIKHSAYINSLYALIVVESGSRRLRNKYIDRDYHNDFNTSCINYATYLFDRNKYNITGTECMAQSQYDSFAANAIKTVLDNTNQDEEFFNSIINKL